MACRRRFENQPVETTTTHRQNDFLLAVLIVIGRGCKHHQVVMSCRPFDGPKHRVDPGDRTEGGSERPAHATAELACPLVRLIAHRSDRLVYASDQLRPHSWILVDHAGDSSEANPRRAGHVNHRRPPTNRPPVPIDGAGLQLVTHCRSRQVAGPSP